MAIPSKQIGWGTEENLLWQISKQIQNLIGVTYNSGSGFSTTYVPYTGATSNVNLDGHNISANAFINGFSSITASGTQVVLTVDSVPEILVSGSGGQTIKLPDATTLANGTTFTFNNNQSSGAITVNNNSNTLVVSVPSGGYTSVTLLSNSSAVGTWDRHDLSPSNVTWSTNTFDYPGSITSATWNGTVIAPNRGGTGQSTYTDGQLLIGNSVGNTLSKSTLTAGSGITITNGNGSITIATTGGGSISGSGTTNYVPKFTSGSSIGNSLIYDNGTNVTINGTAGTGLFNVTGSKTASSAIAQGVYYTPTLVASANSDTLIGLDINPTFTNGSFTGVSNLGIRSSTAIAVNMAGAFYGGFITNSFRNGSNQYSYNSHSPTSSVQNQIYSGSRPATPTTNGISHYVGTDNQTYWDTTNGSYNFLVSGTQQLKLNTTGSLALQNGGTFTDDASARLIVNSTTQGVLFPRMTTTQKNAISSPATGLVVFDTTLGKLCVFSTTWQTITSV